MMSSCKECKKMPSRIYGKMPYSSTYSPISLVPSFFKIMIGDFGKAMFIPPMFAPNLEGMIDRDMYLEDSFGTCWLVKLRKLDSSLAFEQGWHDFVLDHSISLGEIVIFKHISLSLFTVQIYGTSGSERLQFKSKENSNERKRKRSKNETTSDIVCLVKAQRSYEDSEGTNGAHDKGSLKRYRAEKTFPCGLASSAMAAMSHYTVKESIRSLKEYPPRHHHDFGTGKLCNLTAVDYSKAPHKIIDRGKRVEEADRNSPIVLSDDEDDECLGTVVRAKNGLFLHGDKFEGRRKTSVKKHIRNRNEDQTLHESSINKSLLTTERNSSMVCQDAVHEQEVIIISTTNSMNSGTSQSKNNLEGTNVAEANKEKMHVNEKEVTVVHIVDGKRDMAPCNKSDNSCLLGLDRKNYAIENTADCKQEVIQTRSQDTNRMEANEEKQSDQHNVPKRHKTDSREDCIKCDIEIPVVDSSAIINDALVEDMVPMVGCTQEQNIFAKDHMASVENKRNSMPEPELFSIKLDIGSFVENKCERPETVPSKFVGDEGGNLIVSKEFSHNSVVIGEGICCIANEDSEDKVKVISDTSSDKCAERVECNVLDADKAVATGASYLHEACPEVPSGAPTLKHSGDDQGYHIAKGNLDPSQLLRTPQEITSIHCEGNESLQARPLHNINYTQSEGNLGNNADASQARTSQGINYNQAEWHLGMFPGELQEMNAENTASRLKGKILAVCKTEVMDPSYKHHNTMEVDPFSSGTLRGEILEVLDEKVTLCSNGEVQAVVKTEIMDRLDTMQLNRVKFCTTVSLIYLSWLLLPERLPAHLFRKRCRRKVVALQDPSRRLWPVLYHENFNFIGFIGGWEDFATANNLQLGDTCQIEFACAAEPTFKVHFSNVQNPT